MLQINKRRAVEDFEAEEFGTTEPEAASLAAGLEGLLRILRRQFAMIAFVSVLTIALGVLYLFVTPLTFKAEALVKLDREKAQIFQQQQLFADAPVDAATVESEIQILKSDNIARAVIKSLHLTEGPKPEFEKPSNTGSVFDFFFPHPTRSNSGEDTLQDAVSAFLKRVDVQRVGGSYIIAITFTSSNPERAAQIANAIVDAYINYQLQAKFEATHRANVWLQDRLRELSEQSAAADQAVSDYRSKHDIVDTGNGKTMSEQQATDLNARLLDAQAQTSTAQARLDRIESILNKDRDLDEITTGAVVADVLTNPIIVQLRTKYLDLVNREADWSKRYGPNHLAVVNLRTQISEIRNSILDELRQIAETYKSDLAIARQRQEAITKTLAGVVSLSAEKNQAQSVLANLEDAAKSRHLLYADLQQRYTQSISSESLEISGARLITPASTPLVASSPKRLVVLAIAALAGLVIGSGIGLLRDMLDRVFRTSAQIEHSLQTACIALVPAVKSESIPNLQSNPLQHTSDIGLAGPRDIARKPNIIWSVCDSPFSRFAEAIRSLKLAVDLNRMDRPNSIVGCTSALPNEGKTTIAANLALLASQAGARVILVDGDFRNPSLSRTLTPDANCGILEVISGESSLEEVVWKDQSTAMAFLPAFVPFRLAHSSEILASDRMARLFERLRQSYDYVIMDLPPLAPVVDVRATKRLVDAYILVVEWGRTKIPLVERALGETRGVYENLLGVVLNKTDMDVVHRYEAHLDDYYHNNHYSRYGYVD